jgi:hypothetical protein
MIQPLKVKIYPLAHLVIHHIQKRNLTVWVVLLRNLGKTNRYLSQSNFVLMVSAKKWQKQKVSIKN